MSDDRKAVVKHRESSLDRLRKAGSAGKARDREISANAQSMETSGWGKIMGKPLSEGSRYALARMCHVVKADYTLDIDLLGGHPYLNATYYTRRAQNHERYVGHKYLNILDDPEKRKEYGVPEDALGVYVVILTIYIPSAPLAKIRAGKIPFDESMKWTTTVPGCNWAGNKRKRKSKKEGWYTTDDVIGVSEPDKTARTRAYRKAAANAFGTEFIDEQAIQQAEARMEQDIEEGVWSFDNDTVAEDDEVIVGDGGAAEIVEGDIEAADDIGPDIEPEPMDDDGQEPMPVETEPEPDRNELRRRYFATLKAAGLYDTRKEWESEQHGLGLPASVTEWTVDHFEDAYRAIMDPLEERVRGYCETLGESIEDLSLRILNRDRPEWASHWKTLETVLEGRIEDSGEEAQQGALL